MTNRYVTLIGVLLSLASLPALANWSFGGRCHDGVAAVVDGRSALLSAVVSSYPKWDGGVKMLGAAPTFNNTTGVLTVSEKLNLTTATATNRTIQLTFCTDDVLRCVPGERTVAPCPSGYAPERTNTVTTGAAVLPYTEAFGAVPLQDVGAVALLALAFVVGFVRGVK